MKNILQAGALIGLMGCHSPAVSPVRTPEAAHMTLASEESVHPAPSPRWVTLYRSQFREDIQAVYDRVPGEHCATGMILVHKEQGFSEYCLSALQLDASEQVVVKELLPRMLQELYQGYVRATERYRSLQDGEAKELSQERTREILGVVQRFVETVIAHCPQVARQLGSDVFGDGFFKVFPALLSQVGYRLALADWMYFTGTGATIPVPVLLQEQHREHVSLNQVSQSYGEVSGRSDLFPVIDTVKQLVAVAVPAVVGTGPDQLRMMDTPTSTIGLFDLKSTDNVYVHAVQAESLEAQGIKGAEEMVRSHELGHAYFFEVLRRKLVEHTDADELLVNQIDELLAFCAMGHKQIVGEKALLLLMVAEHEQLATYQLVHELLVDPLLEVLHQGVKTTAGQHLSSPEVLHQELLRLSVQERLYLLQHSLSADDLHRIITHATQEGVRRLEEFLLRHSIDVQIRELTNTYIAQGYAVELRP